MNRYCLINPLTSLRNVNFEVAEMKFGEWNLNILLRCGVHFVTRHCVFSPRRLLMRKLLNN